MTRASFGTPADSSIETLNAMKDAMVDLGLLKTRFTQLNQQTPRVFSAPGRVNLIGEHTDYNDGFVLPIAINRRTFVAGAPRVDTKVVVHSLTFSETVQFDLSQPSRRRRGSWLDYIEGTARSMLARGFGLTGANLMIDSDIPVGAGLSASAALELSVGYALASLAGAANPNPLLLALAGQSAEHEYVGTLCGIMDQYICALAQRGRALLIDCRSLTFEPISLQLGSACVLLCDTLVKHELASSSYNERRRQCEEGVQELARQKPNIRALRDLTMTEFEDLAPRLSPLIAQRCRHVVRENARTLAAARALQTGQLAQLGRLMAESHASLRDDYTVSCVELDEAVAAVADLPGVYGSRMTGGGFGGCTVTVLEREVVPRAIQLIQERLHTRCKIDPQFFATDACAGAGEEIEGA